VISYAQGSVGYSITAVSGTHAQPVCLDVT